MKETIISRFMYVYIISLPAIYSLEVFCLFFAMAVFTVAGLGKRLKSLYAVCRGVLLTFLWQQQVKCVP